MLLKNMFIGLMLLIFSVLIPGCAENQTFNVAGIQPLEIPKEVGENPLGTTALKIGMSKDEVKSLWGKPDFVNTPEYTPDASGSVKEEWVYKARRYSPIPIDVEYLSNTKHLFFDGNNLTKIEEEK